MESNAPAHDFAPSWLKIPTIQTKTAPVADKQTPFGEDNFSFRPQYFKRDSKLKDVVNNYANNSDTVDAKDRKIPPSISGKQNSFDFDSSNFHKQSTVNGGNGNLNRRYNKIKPDSNRRPSSRQEFRNATSYHSKSGHQFGSEERPHFSDYALEDANNAISKRNPGIIDSNTFNKEFPSLINDSTNIASNVNGNSVWDNAKQKVLNTMSRKVTLLPRHLCSTEDGQKSPEAVNGSTAYYRTLVPVTKNRGKNAKEMHGLISSLGHNAKIVPLFKTPLQLSSPTMEILVRNPKTRSNKNEFLRALRSDNSKEDVDKNNENLDMASTNTLIEKKNEKEVNLMNDSSCDKCESEKGIEISKLRVKDEREVQLSSSLEAERRLLIEMGWKEEDEDPKFYAPLTDDEVKEYKDLIMARSQFKRHANLNWRSPKKCMPSTSLDTFCTAASLQDLDEDSTTSSDDDDIDV